MLNAGWDSNPDGGGIAYINEHNQIVTYKTMDKRDFIDEYTRAHAQYGATSCFLVHMRIATHGKVKLETAHPFKVPHRSDSGETWMIHNGIISDMTHLTDDDTSDTMALANHLLRSFDDGWLDNDELTSLIGDYIDWSKLVFLTNTPDHDFEMYIINEAMGKWDDEYGWFSNQSCHTPAKAKHTWKGYNPFKTDTNDKSYTYDYSIPERMFDTTDMSLATGSEWHEMVLKAMADNAYCTHCMGKYECVCEDACAECFEMYWECDCDYFFSIDKLINDLEVDGVSTGGGWELAKKEPEPLSAAVDFSSWLRDNGWDDENYTCLNPEADHTKEAIKVAHNKTGEIIPFTGRF